MLSYGAKVINMQEIKNIFLQFSNLNGSKKETWNDLGWALQHKTPGKVEKEKDIQRQNAPVWRTMQQIKSFELQFYGEWFLFLKKYKMHTMFPLKCELEVLNNVQNNLHPIPLEHKR